MKSPQLLHQKLPPNVIHGLENIYISPLELCNLNCRYCYTQKTKNILSNQQILDFVEKYSQFTTLKSIIFCGGEVFTLPNFPALVNQLLSQKIFITIITNGTIDKLDLISDPKNCQLLVSFDGPQAIHDTNRGAGNFQKSLSFVQKALHLGFPVEIMFLITKDSYPYKDSFDILGLPKTYLTDRLHSLSSSQVIDIKTNYPTFPANNFGCSTLSLQSNGQIYGCCESSLSLGHITDNPKIYVQNFINSLTTCSICKASSFLERNHASEATRVSTNKRRLPKQIVCGGCCDPNYLCGYTKELNCQNCQQVVKLFHP